MDIYSRIRLNSGNEMPVIGLGTWQLSDDTPGAVEEALRFGYRMIDTSGDYGTQPGIKEGVRNSNIDRQDIYMVTKVEEYEDAYESTVRNVGELGLEYADLMLVHRPPRSGAGVELWDDLIQAKKDGLAVDIGVSNYSIEQMEALVDATGVVPAVNQIEWSPFGYSTEMLKYCKRNKVVIQAYSPLTHTERLGNETVRDVSSNYQKTPAQILIRWSLQTGAVPLPKANNLEHLKENLYVFDFEIGKHDMSKLNGLNESYSALGSSLMYA